MDIKIDEFPSDQQQGVKDFILQEWKEFGLEYVQKFDFDLDDPDAFYVKPGGAFYVLHDEDKIFGTIGIANEGDAVAELKRFFVDKNFRGKGYGTQLLDKAIIFCKENGFHKIALVTGKEFTQGHELYLKKGFTIIKENDEDYYMEKIL